MRMPGVTVRPPSTLQNLLRPITARGRHIFHVRYRLSLPSRGATDLQRALRIELNNEVVKTELARVDGLIVAGKGKTVRILSSLFHFSLL
ncbi:hypothetical protein BJV78DRAFT_1260491 [Lactifluus subvellereus]|nr:hypothetical protein BJV78DRAFT_1270898 [Lactifluus subvellereus]KAI0245782.1 hypothetical protein BJV78DRAFT_1260491 [Lactifluus subvellereus]